MSKNQTIENLKEILDRNEGVIETVHFDKNEIELPLKYEGLEINSIEEHKGSVYFNATNKVGENISSNIDSMTDDFITEVYFFIENNIIC